MIVEIAKLKINKLKLIKVFIPTVEENEINRFH